jgi:hypothetical protein
MKEATRSYATALRLHPLLEDAACNLAHLFSKISILPIPTDVRALRVRAERVCSNSDSRTNSLPAPSHAKHNDSGHHVWSSEVAGDSYPGPDSAVETKTTIAWKAAGKLIESAALEQISIELSCLHSPEMTGAGGGLEAAQRLHSRLQFEAAAEAARCAMLETMSTRLSQRGATTSPRGWSRAETRASLRQAEQDSVAKWRRLMRGLCILASSLEHLADWTRCSYTIARARTHTQSSTHTRDALRS